MLRSRADPRGREKRADPAGEQVCRRPARPGRARVPAGLRARTQSGGVHPALLETPRVPNLCPARLQPAQLSRSPGAAPHASPARAADGLLGASGPVSPVTNTMQTSIGACPSNLWMVRLTSLVPGDAPPGKKLARHGSRCDIPVDSEQTSMLIALWGQQDQTE
jgi:hypothetical protein